MNITERAENWVRNWLKYCDNKNIAPWEFDFKQCYLEDDIEDKSNLWLELAYKYTNLLSEKNTNFNVTKNTGANADCDKEAFYIYHVLGWQKEINDSVRGDSMNSFATTFTPLLLVNKTPFSIENNKTWNDDFSGVPNIYTELKYWVKNDTVRNIEKFHFNTENLRRIKNGITSTHLLNEIEQFAQSTHSIGNFTVMLSWMNQGRGSGNVKDYWDLTLKNLQDFLMQFEHGERIWMEFIGKYYLFPFVDNNYTVSELWDNHFEKSVTPSSIADFEQFYRNVNLLIEERGKWITKILCEKLNLIDLHFYKNTLADVKKIRYFNEIIN
ncbi:hypothetical protein [Oceanobacillus massiliensis]|uniref:hypothetical protein n=1 Tax=Oceanobacillus massiliensis TaxID=1465765 RepID=UPI000288000E|nr:hypothetical protein [Oceanobacillus massiliensis]